MAKHWGPIMDDIIDLLNKEGLSVNEQIVLLDNLLDQLQSDEEEEN